MDFRATLEAAGITIRRESSFRYHAHCPRHRERTGHVDRRPSWSIDKHTGNHHCFSCQYAGTFTALLVDLTGSAPPDLELELNEQSFLRRMAEVRADPESVLPVPIVTDWVLRYALHDVPQQLLSLRYLRRDAIDRYGVRWDRPSRRWVLPLRTHPGDRLVGAQYRQHGNVDTQPAGLAKSQLLFGLAQAAPQDHVVVVESPLDAVRLGGLGIPAVSTLGAWMHKDQAVLLARNFSWVCLALDNDKVGKQGHEVASQMLTRLGTPALQWSYTGLCDDEGRPAKDVGDVPHDDHLLGAWDRTQRFGL